ncbi:MAG: N-acetylmuramoyl-L-alanine amidase, partial [Lachnospiraceae bacterium]|nr:N-acetylmuramoyl-L-alanine amidase [Lachnospiraceae bacterium]
MGKLTGILTDNGVALGPYHELFVRGLGISCKKDSEKNTLTFKKDGNVLVLTVNSKKAVLNGKEVTMSAAPVSVRFVDAGISRIMVPTRFVAESLGYHYRWESSISTAIIRDKLILSYNNKQVSYIGTTGKVNFDGKDISLSGLPSILINNTAMLRAQTVFGNAMGIQYSYDRESGQITFKTGDIVLNMQENSTAAYRNGEYFDCGVAPIFVTNMSGGTTELMVPGRFVSEKLGFDYNWNSTTKTSQIQTTDKVGVLPKAQAPSQTVPSQTQPLTDQVEYSFVVDAERYLEFENMLDHAKTGIARSLTGETALLKRLSQNPDELYCEQYVLEFDRPVGSVQGSLTQNQLMVTVGDAYVSKKEYSSPSGSLVTHISQGQDISGTGAVFTMELSDNLPYYDLKLSEDGRKLSVTIFPNYLVGLEVGRNQTGKYMRFKGVQAFQYTLGSEEGYQAVYFHNTCNTVGNLVFPDDLFGSYFEHAYMVETDPNQIKLLYRTTGDTDLKFVQESNTLYVYFEMNEQNNPSDVPDNTRPLQKGIYGALPNGVKVSDITVEDQYWNRKIILTIPGNHTEFYQSNELVNPYAVVEDISVRFDGTGTQIVLTTGRIQGYKLGSEGKGFSLLIGNPSEIYNKIVVLDAGHGGIDPGAVAGGYNEKDINFTILNQYTRDYFEGSDIKVYFTRLEDVKIDLYERADFASRVEADLFISLHMNSV